MGFVRLSVSARRRLEPLQTKPYKRVPTATQPKPKEIYAPSNGMRPAEFGCAILVQRALSLNWFG